jgi:hypothetical protein
MEIYGESKAKKCSAHKYQEGGCSRKKKTHHQTSTQSDSHGTQ